MKTANRWVVAIAGVFLQIVLGAVSVDMVSRSWRYFHQDRLGRIRGVRAALRASGVASYIRCLLVTEFRLSRGSLFCHRDHRSVVHAITPRRFRAGRVDAGREGN